MRPRFKVAIAVILVAAFFIGWAGWNVLDRIDHSSASAARAEQINACQRKADRQAFATILDLLADNFATAPYPDPDRKKAVAGMRATADLFRTAPTPKCPG